jgi:hypothetical protein
MRFTPPGPLSAIAMISAMRSDNFSHSVRHGPRRLVDFSQDDALRISRFDQQRLDPARDNRH